MKDKTIKAMAERVGQTRAEKFWALFVERLCEGIEPEDGDTFKREDIEEAFKNNPTARDAFIAVLCGEQKQEPPKGRKFKAGRSYNPEEYAAFYEQFPENVSLIDAITQATDGKPWVVFTTKFHAPESAKYIQWHMNEDIAPATIDVDDAPVAPVMPGEEHRKETKEYPVDPHTPGGFLDVYNKSPRTGADFTGYTEEEIQATIMAYSKLVRMDDISLQKLTLENRGKGAVAILKPFPELAAVWARRPLKDRPYTKAAKRPFVEPSAPTAPREGVNAPPSGAHRIFVFGANAAGDMWASMREAFAGLMRQGVVIESDREMPAGASVARWHSERVQSATLFLVLLTSGFAASSELEEVEALYAAGRKIVPVKLRPVDISFSSLALLTALPKQQPVSQFGDKDVAYTEITAGIRAVLAKMAPPQSRAVWNRNMLLDVLAAVGSASLDRGTLMSVLDPRLVAQIRRGDTPAAQTLQDLTFLDQLRAGGDPQYLREYLTTAAHMTKLRREQAVFHAALAALS